MDDDPFIFYTRGDTPIYVSQGWLWKDTSTSPHTTFRADIEKRRWVTTQEDGAERYIEFTPKTRIMNGKGKAIRSIENKTKVVSKDLKSLEKMDKNG